MIKKRKLKYILLILIILTISVICVLSKLKVKTSTITEKLLKTEAKEGETETILQEWDISATKNDSVKATLYQDGKLIISGQGNMASYGNQKWGSNIKTVIIESGVTSIGRDAFYGCSSLTSINIPEGVTSIGDGAFEECINLTNIIISESVTDIGESVFYNCSNLTSIIIPKNVTTIGNNAFYGCRSLTSIVIPEGVTSIGKTAFRGCMSLRSITVNSKNKNYMDDNGVLYTKDKTKIIKYPIKKEGSNYDILEGVTNIENGVFEGCSSLKNITIPKGITNIGESVFYGCSSLTSIIIPKGVTSIGDYAFEYCSNLKKVIIQEGLTSIGVQAFSNCNSLININIPEGVTSIERYTFLKCENLLNITMPGSIKIIKDGAFAQCERLQSIKINDNVISIGDSVFENCNDLTNIIVSSNNKNYIDDNGVLYTKDKTRLIHYPAKKENVHYVIPEGVKSIEKFAFGGCDNLMNITIPDGATTIGTYSFVRCTRLESITIPQGITNIGFSTFKGCINLNSIIIPESVTTISTGAFNECSNLTIYCQSNTVAHNYAKENNIKYELDDEAPKITKVEQNIKEKTKENVTLTIIATDEIVGLANKPYSFDGGTTWQESNTKEYTANTNGIEIKVKDKLGNIATYGTKINITNIDKEAVIATVTTNKEQYYEGEKVTVTAKFNEEIKDNTTKIIIKNEKGETRQAEIQMTKISNQEYQYEYTAPTQDETEIITIKGAEDLVGNKMEDNTSKRIKIETIKLEKIEIEQQVNKKEYIEEENFDTRGLKIKAKYNNGTEKEIEAYSIINNQEKQGYKITNGTNLKANQTSVTISYTEKNITKTVEQKITVKEKPLSLEIKQYSKKSINGKECLTTINPKTTIADLNKNIETNGTIKIYKNNKEIANSNEKLATGMQVKITLNNQSQEYTIIVTGDANGDGEANIMDMLSVNKHRLNKVRLENEYYEAADTNKDGKVDIMDILQLNKYRLGKIENL